MRLIPPGAILFVLVVVIVVFTLSGAPWYASVLAGFTASIAMGAMMS